MAINNNQGFVQTPGFWGGPNSGITADQWNQGVRTPPPPPVAPVASPVAPPPQVSGASGRSYTPPASPAPQVATPPPAITPASYKVAAGDSLSKIAYGNGLTLDKIKELNPQFSKNWNLVLPGQIINLPPKVERPGINPVDMSAAQQVANQVNPPAPEAPARGSSILEDYLKKFGTVPAAPNLASEQTDLNKTYGVDQWNDNFNQARANQRALEDSIVAGANKIKSQQGPQITSTVINGQLVKLDADSAQALADAKREVSNAADQLDMRNKTVASMMDTKKWDYTQATNEYNNSFTRALSLFTAAQTEENQQYTRETAELTRAAAQGKVLYDSIKDYPDLYKNPSPELKSQFSTLETKAGLPSGFFEGILAASPEVKVDHWQTVGGTTYAYGKGKDGSPVLLKSFNTPAASAGGNDVVSINGNLLAIGNLVPSLLTGMGAGKNAIIAEADTVTMKNTGKHYNAIKEQLDYEAAKRFVTSGLNSSQMVRFKGLGVSVVNTIDEVARLADLVGNIGITPLNNVKLLAYAKLAGNTEQGQIVAQYLGATNTLKEEFANLVNGGYAPTEPAFALANQQINSDYGVKQLRASLFEVQKLINYRLNAFSEIGPSTLPVGEGGTGVSFSGGSGVVGGGSDISGLNLRF